MFKETRGISCVRNKRSPSRIFSLVVLHQGISNKGPSGRFTTPHHEHQRVLSSRRTDACRPQRPQPCDQVMLAMMYVSQSSQPPQTTRLCIPFSFGKIPRHTPSRLKQRLNTLQSSNKQPIEDDGMRRSQFRGGDVGDESMTIIGMDRGGVRTKPASGGARKA